MGFAISKGWAIRKKRKREASRLLTDKHLSHRTTSGESQHIGPYRRVARHELEGLAQLAGAASHVHAEPLADAGLDKPGAEDEVRGGDGGAHEVVGAHHLRPRVGLEGAEDVVLGAVGEAVKQQVNGQQQQAPGHVALLVRHRRVLLATALLARVQREDGDARRHGRDHQVLV